MKYIIFKILANPPISECRPVGSFPLSSTYTIGALSQRGGLCQLRLTAPAHRWCSQAWWHIKLHQNLHTGHLVLIGLLKLSWCDHRWIPVQFICKESTAGVCVCPVFTVSDSMRLVPAWLSLFLAHIFTSPWMLACLFCCTFLSL